MLKGLLKGILLTIVIVTALVIFSFLGLMSSIVPQFNLFYFLLVTIGIWQFLYLLPWYRKKTNQDKRREAMGILLSALLGLIILFLNLDYLQSFKRISLDELEKKELKFIELPKSVQLLYESHNFTEYGKFLSSDKKQVISTYASTMDDGFVTLLKEGFKHHFLIDGKHFILQANQGDPFILHDSKFYYCKDLNLSIEKIKSAIYVEINLNNRLK